jgi:hypothetical protein
MKGREIDATAVAAKTPRKRRRSGSVLRMEPP